MEQVLMVDDDVKLCQMVTEFLEPEGFCVTGVHDGLTGLQEALNGSYVLVLLDVMLARLSGFEVLRRLRAAPGPEGQIPVLMLTARGAAADRVIGFEVGADDYLPKPFNERELVGRMRAILRRARSGTATQDTSRELMRVGDITLDAGARLALCGGKVLALTAVEFDLLSLFLDNAGTAISRRQITHDVFDRKLESFDRSLDTHISRLRRKLGPHPHGDERIKTVRSLGYIYTMPAKIFGDE